jgi:hypothetical protein
MSAAGHKDDNPTAACDPTHAREYFTSSPSVRHSSRLLDIQPPHTEAGELKSQTSYRLPKSWDDIEVGDLVLAKDTDPENGWWEAIVVKKHGDMYTLKWRQTLLPQRQRLLKHKFNLGLMWPGVDVDTETLTQNGSRSAFPASWKTIAAEHVVLAKEEGPMENWWDATVTNSDSKDLSLRWLGFETLPEIKRPRLALALLHANPAGAKASSNAAA